MGKFEIEVLWPIVGFLKSSLDVAFVINEKTYSYYDVACSVSKIRTQIQKEKVASGIPYVGLVLNNDIETYASIIALWLEGLCYVPLNPSWPTTRSDNIVKQVGLNYILDSENNDAKWNVNVISTSSLSFEGLNLLIKKYPGSNFAYILFTSGSTGEPKGVPITRDNLAGFVNSMNNIGLRITSKDRCLQPFDLSFDFSVSSYLVPLVHGASIYTVPAKVVKYLYIANLINKDRLTILQMVPSMIRNMLPYIDELDLSCVRYNILCGEALEKSDIFKWHEGYSEMVSYNMYGPTENTVFCTYYIVSKDNLDSILASNDVVSIGRSFPNSGYLLIDEGNNPIKKSNIEGELCLCGIQLTPGYWRNDNQNELKFFDLGGTRYYKSGDLCYYSEMGDLMYICRIDSQVKINGYRVELGEIESLFRQVTNNQFCVAITYKNNENLTDIALVTEEDPENIEVIKNYLSQKLPHYMIPKQYFAISPIPLNPNGKIDRREIYKILGLEK